MRLSLAQHCGGTHHQFLKSSSVPGLSSALSDSFAARELDRSTTASGATAIFFFIKS